MCIFLFLFGLSIHYEIDSVNDQVMLLYNRINVAINIVVVATTLIFFALQYTNWHKMRYDKFFILLPFRNLVIFTIYIFLSIFTLMYMTFFVSQTYFLKEYMFQHQKIANILIFSYYLGRIVIFSSKARTFFDNNILVYCTVRREILSAYRLLFVADISEFIYIMYFFKVQPLLAIASIICKILAFIYLTYALKILRPKIDSVR